MHYTYIHPEDQVVQLEAQSDGYSTDLFIPAGTAPPPLTEHCRNGRGHAKDGPDAASPNHPGV